MDSNIARSITTTCTDDTGRKTAESQSIYIFGKLVETITVHYDADGKEILRVRTMFDATERPVGCIQVARSA